MAKTLGRHSVPRQVELLELLNLTDRGQAFLVGEELIANQKVALILGDNLFYGRMELERIFAEFHSGARVFGYPVKDPERYGVVEFDDEGRAVALVEKPTDPRSRYAITGLYFYDNQVVSIARSLAPSARGELEITDVNRTYLERGQLRISVMGRGTAWLDTGTHESLLDAAQFIQTLERRQGLKVACPEEIAWRVGWIDDEALRRLAQPLVSSDYGRYLLDLLEF